MQAVPASSLEVIQATFLLGIFIKLLNDPTGMSKRNELRQLGLGGNELNQYFVSSGGTGSLVEGS
jgi:hypothetical protein